MLKRAVVSLVVVGVCLGLTTSGNTGTTSTTMSVSASVAAACTVSANSLNFGAVSASSPGGVLATANITVNCQNGSPYSIALGGGNFLSGGVRNMALDPNYTIGYFLYKNNDPMQAWGDGVSLGAVQLGTGTGSNQIFTVYGTTTVGSQNPLAAGSYSDSVAVTVSF